MMRSLPSPMGGLRSALCADSKLPTNEDSVTTATLRNERRGILKVENNRGIFISKK
jgi:hypothetical protein